MFLLANESPRGPMTGHISEQKEQRRRKEKHRLWKTCKEALSRDTGQWNGNGCRDIWEWAHSHGILMQVKPMNSRQIYQHQNSPSRSQVEQKLLSKPQLALEGWSHFALTKLKLPRLSLLHLRVSRSTSPTCWGVCRRSVNAEEDMNVAWLSRPHSEMFNSGCRQSTHWTGELVFKNRKLKRKLVNSTSTPTAEVSCLSHLHLGESSCSCLSEVTFGPFSSSDGSFPALLG